MKTSNEINELAAALMVVQNVVGNLHKSADGYGYSYTPLDAVTDAIRDPLAENGLSYVQMPTTPPIEYYPSVSLTTRLMHVSGQWLEDTMIIPVPSVGKANEAQSYGAALTYARRYALTAMFGIAGDADTDANLPDQKSGKSTSQPKAKQQKPTAPPSSGIQPPMPDATMKKRFHALGVTVYGDAWDDKRPELVKAVSAKRQDGPAVTSSNELYRAEMQHLIDGMAEKVPA